MKAGQDGRRYPGAHSFDDTPLDRKLFFGRVEEVKDLFDTILAERLVILYAKSGLGKTSLLNAGIKQALREQDFLPLVVRLNNATARPMGALFHGVSESARTQGIEHRPGLTDSLWNYFKTTEFWRGDSLLVPVLILDQFEELFTLHDADQRRDFIEHLSQLFRGPRQDEASSRLGRGIALSDSLPVMKIVISMREDYLPSLEELATFIPGVLRTRFRLNPLSRESARSAIQEPARIADGELATPRFTFAEDIVEAILDLHSSRTSSIHSTNGAIEPFQLQLICHHVEDLVRRRLERQGNSWPEADGTRSAIEVHLADLGGISGIREIIEEFYERQLDEVSSSYSRRRLERLCEAGLVNRAGKRLSLEEQEIASNFKIPRKILTEMSKRRILRAEPRLDSLYYELSHDILVDPVIASRTRRRHRTVWNWGRSIAAIFLVVVATALWRRHDAEVRRELIDGAQRAVLNSDSEAGLILAVDAAGRSLNLPGAVSEVAVALSTIMTKPTLTEASLGDGRSVARAIASDGRTVLDATADGQIELHDRGGRMLLRMKLSVAEPPAVMTFNPDGDEFAVAAGSFLQAYDVAGNIVLPPKALPSPMTALAFSSAGDTLFAATRTRQVCSVALLGNSVDCSAGLGDRGDIRQLIFEASADRVLGLSEDGNVYQWQYLAGHLKPIDEAISRDNPSMVRGWVVSDDRTAVAATVGSTLVYWRGGRQDPVQILGSVRPERDGTVVMALSQDGSRLAVTAGDSDVAVFNMQLCQTPDCSAEYRNPYRRYSHIVGDRVSSLAWSKAPGSNQLAIGGDGVFVGGDAVPSISSSYSELNPANGPPEATGRQAGGTEGQNRPSGRNVLSAGPESDDHAARALFLSHFHQRFIAMAYFADGSLLTASADGDLDRWRPDRSHVEKFARPISGSGYGHVTCLVTSPDNKFFLLGDDNTNFELWSTEAIGGPERTTDKPATRQDVDSDVQAMRLNWDGTKAVLIDKKQNVSQWAIEANDLRLLKTIGPGEGASNRVSRTPISRPFGSESLVAYYAPGKAGDLVVGTTGGGLRRLAGPLGAMNLAQLSDPIVSMDADAGGNLFLGTRGGWLLWRGVDTKSSAVVIPYANDQQYQDSALTHIEHSKSNSVLITTSADEKVTLYRMDTTYSKLADFALRTPDVDSVAVSADGGEIEFLTANRKLVHATLNIPRGAITLNDDRIAISPRDDFAVTLNLDQHVLKVFDPELRHPLWSTSSFSGRCEPSAFSIAPDGGQIVVGCAQGRLALVTPSGSAEPPPPTTLFDRDETITSINDFGSFFVGGSDKGRLAIWSSTGEPMQGPFGSSDLTTTDAPTPSMFLSNPSNAGAPAKVRAVEAITTSAIGPDGDLLAAGTARGELTLWRIDQGKIEPQRVWTREPISSAAVSSVAFSSGEKLILAVYKDGEVLKYKTDNGEESSEFHIDAPAGLNSSAFSAGGKYLVTTDSGGNVQIWNDDGRALTPAIPVGSEPLDAVFRPDGESIALSRVKSFDPVLPSSPQEWLLHACNRLTYSSEVAESSNQEAAEAHKICGEAFKRAGDRFSDERLSDLDSSSQLAIGRVWSWLTGNRGSAGPTPLQQAAGEGRLKEVQDLVSKGASVNESDLEGHTALTAALRAGYADVATYLISKGADYRSGDKWGGVTPVHVAAASGLVAVCRKLIDLGVPVDQTDSGGVTPLMIASWRGDMALLRFLLSRNASVNKPDKFGRTPLIDAVQSERLPLAEQSEPISAVGVLLDHGADVNQMTYFGEPFGTTALLLAKWNQWPAVSNRILGAKPLIENPLPYILVRIDLRILPARLTWAAPKIAGCSDGTLARGQQEQYFNDVTAASRRGDADAEFLMGLAYAMGCGTLPDQMKARAGFQAAAHNGSTLGEAAYGLSLWLAEGGSQPKDSGLEEIETAANRGDPFGVWLDAIATRWDEQSKSEALSMTAAQAFAPAANSVASRDIRIPRRGLNEDRIKQMESYLQSGSERGDVTAMVNLGVFHAYTIRDFATSIQDWKAAFAANDQMVPWPGTKRLARSDAAFNLGQAYHFGLGVERSDAEAAQWYEQAQDDREALEELAWMYEHGQGVPKSLAEAVTLYREAAAGGSLLANARLASLNYGP